MYLKFWYWIGKYIPTSSISKQVVPARWDHNIRQGHSQHVRVQTIGFSFQFHLFLLSNARPRLWITHNCWARTAEPRWTLKFLTCSHWYYSMVFPPTPNSTFLQHPTQILQLGKTVRWWPKEVWPNFSKVGEIFCFLLVCNRTKARILLLVPASSHPSWHRQSSLTSHALWFQSGWWPFCQFKTGSVWLWSTCVVWSQPHTKFKIRF